MEYGKHVIIQISGVKFELLRDEAIAESFLKEAVAAAGMRILGLHVYNIKKELEAKLVAPDPDEPEGISGVAVLSTSHAAIDTWPHRGYAIINVYSCKEFEVSKIVDAIECFYHPSKLSYTDVSHSLVPYEV